jgi:predicted nuclease of predicted toxin-antitoxin system
VANASAIRLRMLGHDVVRVGTDIRIPDDVDILALATSEQRVLVTHDQDFGDLVFNKRQRAPHGVILFRYEPSDPEAVAKRLTKIIGSGLYEFSGHMTVVEESKVRQRKC